MGVFKEIYEAREVSGKLAYAGLKRRLEEAISRGWIEQVAVVKPNRFSPGEEWFRDKETGEIYRLVPPEDRGGWWDKVEVSELKSPDEKVH